jgi:hypothetical protein
MDDDRDLKHLAREYTSFAFQRRGKSYFSTSTAAEAPINCRPIASRAQAAQLLYDMMARRYEDTMAAINTGNSTCRGSKDAVRYVADLFGRSSSTVGNVIRSYKRQLTSSSS